MKKGTALAALACEHVDAGRRVTLGALQDGEIEPEPPADDGAGRSCRPVEACDGLDTKGQDRGTLWAEKEMFSRKIEKIAGERGEKRGLRPFLIAGLPVTYKVQKRMEKQEGALPFASGYPRAHRGGLANWRTGTGQNRLEQGLDDDFSFAASGLDAPASTCFTVGQLCGGDPGDPYLPDPKEIGIPDEVMNFAFLRPRARWC